ncbi:unnamed protein product, partial [Ectocarpus sp. 12 AP-2014]
ITTTRRPSAAIRGGQLHPKPRAASRNHGYHHGGGFDGIGHGRGLDGWSANVRYFLARYPPETRDLVAQRLASNGIRSLLSSHRQENLSLDALLAATDAADREVLSSMREHARGRQKQRGAAAPLSRSRTSSPQGQQRQHPRANGGNAAAPPEVLRERVLADKNIDANPPAAAGAVTVFRKRHEVAARPGRSQWRCFSWLQVAGLFFARGVLPVTSLFFVVTTAFHTFIRRLAHEAFRELKASALGIRLSDLPCALQFLFFADSASLLTSKGGRGGGGGDGGGGARGANRSAKDVHLVMGGMRESLAA